MLSLQIQDQLGLFFWIESLGSLSSVSCAIGEGNNRVFSLTQSRIIGEKIKTVGVVVARFCAELLASG